LYLIIVFSLIFLFYFIISLFYTIDDIINNKDSKLKKVLFLLFLIVFPFLFIPFYYGKYISNKDRIVSYSLIFLNLLLIIGLFFPIKNILNNYLLERDRIKLKETFNYQDKLGIFNMEINKNYVCSYLEGYDLSCEDNLSDSFIGIYTYQDDNFTEGKIDDIKYFHLDEIISYIEESGYDYNEEEFDNYIKITYNDMAIIFKERIYQINDKEYLLIIVRESHDYDDILPDLEKLLETITFIN
jgi:hypothetical protein